MFNDSLVSYELIAEFEDIPVRGNAMSSGDDDYDRQIEDEIFDRLAAGDVWAWAAVYVEARYDGVDSVVGVAHLGCCSYKDEEDFKQPGGYYDDMKHLAREDLYRQLKGILYRFGCVDPTLNTPPLSASIEELSA